MVIEKANRATLSLLLLLFLLLSIAHDPVQSLLKAKPCVTDTAYSRFDRKSWGPFTER